MSSSLHDAVTVPMDPGTIRAVEFSQSLHDNLLLDPDKKRLLAATLEAFRKPVLNGFPHQSLHPEDSYNIPEHPLDPSSNSSCSSSFANKVYDNGSYDPPEHQSNGKLVLLLHGGPGTGKTMAAQFAANYTNRPLLSLNPVRLGSTAAELEVKVKQAFDLSRQWGCIVLFEGCDTYMRRVREGDMVHNNIASSEFTNQAAGGICVRSEANSLLSIIAALLQIIEDYEGEIITGVVEKPFASS